MAGTVVSATIERWWFPAAWNESSLPASRLYFGDALAYLRFAAALSTGELYDNGIPFHPPGWPAVLAAVFLLAGWSDDAPPDVLMLKHLAAVLSGTTVGLAALLAYLVGGRVAMVCASLLGIFHFGHLIQAATPNSEPLYGLLMVAVLVGALSGINRWALGVVAGAATLVRAEFAFAAGLIALWIACEEPGGGRRQAAAFALGVVLTLVPTTIVNWRNIQEFNRTRADRMPGPLPPFVPVTSYGPFNFANANHERAAGGFNWDLPALTADERSMSTLEAGAVDLARPVVYETYVNGYAIGARWIWRNPGSAARLVWSKLRITASVLDYGYLLDNVGARLRGLRRPVDQVDLTTSWLTWLHAALVVCGVWAAVWTPASRLLLAPVATLLVSSALFFGYVRLGVAYVPVLWTLQALGVAHLASLVRLAPRTVGRLQITGAAVVVLLLAAEWSRLDRPRVLSLDGLADESGRFVEDQPMLIERVY